jgi:predicted anti-sigma-YlaC factor YlaD
MNEHLTSQEVTDWQSGVSGAEELLRQDDHLSECAECRALVAGPVAVAGLTVRMLRAEFSSAHLTELQLDDYAAHRPLPADLMQHLDVCGDCRGDAADLRHFAEANPGGKDNERAAATTHSGGKAPVPIRRVVPVAWSRSLVAALAIAVAGLSVWFAMHRQSPGKPANPSSANQEPVPFNIPAPYRGEVQAAVESGNLQIPAVIAGLKSGPIQLRSVPGSETKQPDFHLISPLATAVVDDIPVFRWTPLAGTTFSVAIYDDQFRAVAKGVSIKGTEWHPEKPLARGAIYRWEVRAVRGGHVDRAPAPTEPEARFAVLGAVEAQRLVQARAAMPNAPLALGILDADSGALEDARRELSNAVTGGDEKQKALAERLLGQLK